MAPFKFTTVSLRVPAFLLLLLLAGSAGCLALAFRAGNSATSPPSATATENGTLRMEETLPCGDPIRVQNQLDLSRGGSLLAWVCVEQHAFCWWDGQWVALERLEMRQGRWVLTP